MLDEESSLELKKLGSPTNSSPKEKAPPKQQGRIDSSKSKRRVQP